jgi:hypothetical protein
VILTDGAVAIDVDNDRSHGIATTLLYERMSLAQAAE